MLFKYTLKKVPYILCLCFLSMPFISSNIFAEELNIYSGRKSKFVKPLLDEFSKQTGVNVNLKTGNSSLLLSRLCMQGNRTNIDIYIGNDVGNLQRGSDCGIFKNIPETIATIIPKDRRAPDNSWIGLSGRLRILVVNKNSIWANKITSIFDLANPDLKDRIAITRSRNESFIGGVTSYQNVVGYDVISDWLKGLKANANKKVFSKHSKIVSAVSNGEKDVGLVNHYYAYRHIIKHPNAPIKLIFPDQKSGQIGAAWNMAGIGVSKFTKNTEAAYKLLTFLISNEGQRTFATVNREYPARPGVEATKIVKPLKDIRVINAPVSAIGRGRDKTILEIEKLRLK